MIEFRSLSRRLLLLAAALVGGLFAASDARAQEAVSLNFNNQTAGEIHVFWVNPDGREIAYGTIKQGATSPQSTFAGHTWVVRSAAGQVLARLTADRSREIRIGGPAAMVPIQPIAPAQPMPAPAQPAAADPAPQGPVTLQLVNQTSADVHVFWVNGEGREMAYGVIKPGASQEQPTHAGHTWAFRTARGELISRTTADRSREVNIGGRAPANPGVGQPMPNPSANSVPRPNPGAENQVTYWLGIPSQADPATIVFSVRVPDDVATKIIRRNDDKAPGFKTYRRTVGDTSYDFYSNDLVWHVDQVATGQLSFMTPQGGGLTWDRVATDGEWPRFKQQGLDRIATPYGNNVGWFVAKPLMVAIQGTPANALQISTKGPFDTATAESEQSGYHSKAPRIVAVPVDGGIAVGWCEFSGDRPGGAKITRYALSPQGTTKAWEKTLPLPVLGGVATDGTNLFALCAKEEDLGRDRSIREYRPGILQLVKLDPQGNFVWTKDLNNEEYFGPVNARGDAENGIYSPCIAGTGQLAYGNGKLLIALACNTLPDDQLPVGGPARHQRAIFVVVNDDGSGLRMFSQSSNRHSFDQRAIFDGTDFLISELADAGWYMPGAGISIRKAKLGQDAVTFAPAPLEGRYIYVRRGNGGDYSNYSFTSLGDVVAGDRGYTSLFASQKENGVPFENGFENPVPEPRNLAMVHVVKGFEAVPVEDQTKHTTITSDFVDSKGPTLEPITRADKPEKTFRQHGIVWLTNLNAGVSAERPKLVRLGADRYLALWEQWTYQGTGQNLKYQSTQAMLIGEYGDVLRAATPIQARLNPSGADRVFSFGGRAAWLSGDNGGGKFTLHLVDENLTLSRFDLGL